MELYIAIKNILKYQGEEFLFDPKMINALIDFQAYEQHPALKNVFRILHQDGYVGKVKDAGEWNDSLEQILYEIERDYAIPRDIVEFTLKSVSLGLGYSCILPQLSLNNQKNTSAPSQTSIPSGKSWVKMTDLEKSDFLEGKLEIREETFSEYSLKLENISFTGFSHEGGKYYFYVNYELIRSNTRKELFNEMCIAVYDLNGKLRESSGEYLDGSIVKKFYTDQTIVGSPVKFTDISKIVIYMK